MESVRSACLASAFVFTISSVGAQQPSFSGDWLRVVDSASAGGRSVATVGDASFRRGDMGSGWGAALTLTHRADSLIVEYQTVDRLVLKGLLPARKMGRWTVVRRVDLDAFKHSPAFRKHRANRLTGRRSSLATMAPVTQAESELSARAMEQAAQQLAPSITAKDIAAWCTTAAERRWGIGARTYEADSVADAVARELLTLGVSRDVAQQSIYAQAREVKQAEPPRTLRWWVPGIKRDAARARS